MLRCDRCGEEYPDETVFLDERGRFLCGYCLGFFETPSLFEEAETGKGAVPTWVRCRKSP